MDNQFGNANNNDGAMNFAIQRIYVKDLSFESPETPKIFVNQDWKPDVNIELSVKNEKVDNNVYEVVLFITVTLTHEKKTIFINEVKQAGIFSIEGGVAGQLDHLLGSYCPNILFPYAREVISDVVVRGGFPQLLLAPINFDALYEESKKKAANS
ncbi:MAG: protein-export chaperone SecB [Gammaproteobacteria bacterium]|nr:protein-export chaperone SecB [Gammaproteobacteria bacterium]